MKHVLAIDIGASSGRHIVGSLKDGKIEIQEIHRFENGAEKRGDHLVWRVDYLFEEIKTGIKKCNDMGIYPESVAFDTWGVDYVLLDENDNVLGDAISYRDMRTEGMMEEVFKTIPKEQIYDKTGIQFMHLNTIFQLAAQKKEDASLLDSAKTLLTMPDYLGFLLSGEKYNEYTEASTSQLVNAKDRNWDRELISQLGINPDIFLDVTQPGTVVGSVKPEISEKGMKLITVGSHDTASAVAAVPALEKDFLYISSGTWALMGVEENSPSLTPKTMQANFTNEGGVYGTIRLLKNITGMWIIQQVRIAQNKETSFAEYVELAKKEEQFKSIINPDDISFYSPENMVEEIKAFCDRTGQPVPQTKGEIARCVFDSMALAYKKMLSDIESICDKQFGDIHIIGGGCQNVLVNQIAADVTGRKVVAGPIEATAIGNILVQLITLGEIADISAGRKIVGESFDAVEYYPEKDAPDCTAAYDKFLSLM
jgi:rhamnulokinase